MENKKIEMGNMTPEKKRIIALLPVTEHVRFWDGDKEIKCEAVYRFTDLEDEANKMRIEILKIIKTGKYIGHWGDSADSGYTEEYSTVEEVLPQLQDDLRKHAIPDDVFVEISS